MHSDLSKKLLEFLTTDEKETRDSEIEQVFTDAVSGDYEEFVSKLKNWAGDPKVTEFLKSGLKDGITAEDKFTVSQGSIPCSNLIPTQNEIDLNKSLDYPLKDPSSMKKYLDGGEVIIGGPIITFNGRYIIDGHHRWSQVYCINPNAKMKVINFKHSGLGPEDMLKATQVAVAATSGQVQVSTVDGANLLKIPLQQVYKYIVDNIQPECAKLLSKTKEGAAKKIAVNCQAMQKNNQPIKGAPARGFMPQTDEPKGNLGNVVKALSTGITQAIEPFSKQSNLEPMKQESKQTNKKILKEWDPSMSTDSSAPFNQSDYDFLRNQLAILALKDSTLGISYDSLPSVKDSELEMWMEIADPGNKIWKRFEGKINPPKGHFTNPKMKLDDNDGYDKFMAPLIYPYYKLAIHKAKLNGSGMEDDIEQSIGHQKQQMGEALNRLLKEDESVEQADPVTMFQDFSGISGSLADIYSTLVGYQTSYVSNPKVQQAIGTIMSGVNQLMKQSTATMQMLGQSFGLNESQIKDAIKNSKNKK